MRTWISAGVYYASNFLSITKVVNALEDEASSIVAAKKLFEPSEVKNLLRPSLVSFHKCSASFKKEDSL